MLAKLRDSSPSDGVGNLDDDDGVCVTSGLIWEYGRVACYGLLWDSSPASLSLEYPVIVSGGGRTRRPCISCVVMLRC